jgi:hypothetical protein
MQIKRRGVELRLVFNGDRRKAQKADPALLKAIARAHRWFDQLVAGRVASMAEIGKRESVPKNFVSWLIRLAFLAPEIVEAIIQGSHPSDLTAQTLITRRIGEGCKAGSKIEAHGSRSISIGSQPSLKRCGSLAEKGDEEQSARASSTIKSRMRSVCEPSGCRGLFRRASARTPSLRPPKILATTRQTRSSWRQVLSVV